MSEIFSDQSRIYGDIPISRADRQPCIACGHPTGDCKPSEHDDNNIQIAFSGGKHESTKDQRLVYVDRTIYGERQVTPFTTAKVVLARQGTYVTEEKATELGIFPQH